MTDTKTATRENPGTEGDGNDAIAILKGFSDELSPDDSAYKTAARELMSDLRSLDGKQGAKFVDVPDNGWGLRMTFPAEGSDPVSASLVYNPINRLFTLRLGPGPSGIDASLEYDPVSQRFVGSKPIKGPDGSVRTLSGAAAVIKDVWDLFDSERRQRQKTETTAADMFFEKHGPWGGSRRR